MPEFQVHWTILTNDSGRGFPPSSLLALMYGVGRWVGTLPHDSSVVLGAWGSPSHALALPYYSKDSPGRDPREYLRIRFLGGINHLKNPSISEDICQLSGQSFRDMIRDNGAQLLVPTSVNPNNNGQTSMCSSFNRSFKCISCFCTSMCLGGVMVLDRKRLSMFSNTRSRYRILTRVLLYTLVTLYTLSIYATG